MRIAFVPAARVFSDRRAHGESLIAEALIRRLAARGHGIVAYCEEADFESPIPGVEVRTVSAEAPTAALSRIAFARRIARDAAGEEFDVAHLLFPLSTEEGYTLVRGAPLVCGPMFVSWPADGARGRPRLRRAASAVLERVERRLHERTFARAARLLVTGGRARSQVPDRFADRCVEVPIGIDVARFPHSPLPDDSTILFLSVLHPRKGIEVLVRAMPYVLGQIPRARLVVAGDDPHGLRPRLEALAREAGVAGAISFAGPVARERVAETHRRARVFCQPSFGEPYGMTVLEAMSTGRPVVATAAGGITDLVVERRGGRLAPPGDERLLASALIEVLARPQDAEAMAAFNRARCERRFSLDVVADRIELTYEALVASRREGRVDAA